MPETTTIDTTATATETAAETATDTTATDTTTTADKAAEADTTNGEDALGDAGKKALDAMKADKVAAKKEATEAKAALAALQAKLDGKEAEHAAEQAAQKVKDEALSAANQRILKAEFRASAAAKLADPADALRFIDLSEFEVGSDGEVDSSAIAQAIDDLITSKPYLAAQGGSKFQGTADGGARNGATQQSQLTRADVDRMFAAKQYAEIETARSEGRLSKILGG